jgi:hypothetical protein
VLHLVASRDTRYMWRVGLLQSYPVWLAQDTNTMQKLFQSTHHPSCVVHWRVVHFGREMGEGYGHASEWNLEKEKTKARGSKVKTRTGPVQEPGCKAGSTCMYVHTCFSISQYKHNWTKFSLSVT